MTEAVSWAVLVQKLSAQYDEFEVKRIGDSRFWSFMKRHVLKWVAGITIGYTVYIDDALWGTARGASVLRHEAVHVRQWHEWWLIQPLTYFLLLPTLFSMRAYWEWQAYKEDLRDAHEGSINYPIDYRAMTMDYYCQWVAGHFVGWNYFFMFPFWGYMYRKCKIFVARL